MTLVYHQIASLWSAHFIGHLQLQDLRTKHRFCTQKYLYVRDDLFGQVFLPRLCFFLCDVTSAGRSKLDAAPLSALDCAM